MKFIPGETDPERFDKLTTIELIRSFSGPIEGALTSLRAAEYSFPSMQALHRNAIDLELVYRQTLPAAGIATRLRYDIRGIVQYLELFVRCQTLILNHVDRHLDLSSSYTIRNPELLLADPCSTMCYTIASLYSGMSRIGHVDGKYDAPSSISEMATISIQIIQSMNDNYSGRFSEQWLANPTGVLKRYHHPVFSRHIGSGFYSSSIRGALSFFRKDIPVGLNEILLDMRRLRQRVDEIADLHEDMTTGLVTYPVALLLSSSRSPDAEQIIRSAWSRCRVLMSAASGNAGVASQRIAEDDTLNELSSHLRARLESSGVLAACYDEADAMWRDLSRRVSEMDTTFSSVLGPVLDLKRAFLERLHRQGWRDIPPKYSFAQLRASAIGSANGEARHSN